MSLATPTAILITLLVFKNSFQDRAGFII